MNIFNFRNGCSRLAAVVALLTAAWFPAAQAATLKIATLSPEGSSWMKVLRKHGKAVGQRTDGAGKGKFYPGGVMGDDEAVLRKMRVGERHAANRPSVVMRMKGPLPQHRRLAPCRSRFDRHDL